MTQELLAERYGKTKGPRRRDRVIATVIAAVALVAFLVWGISVTAYNDSQITASVIGYQIVADSQVDVKLTIDKGSDKTVICQIEALAKDFEVVGYKEVAFQNTLELNTSIVTIKPAVSAVAKQCWLK